MNALMDVNTYGLKYLFFIRTKVVRFLQKDKILLFVGLILALTYTLLILYYTHGGILYGGDHFGIYSRTNPIYSADSFLAVFSLYFTYGNYYWGFYLYLFIGAFLDCIGMFYLTREIIISLGFSNNIGYFGIIAALLYLYNPTILVNNFQSYVGNISLEYFFFMLLILLSIRIYRKSLAGQNVSILEVFFTSLTLALSAGHYPNNIRVLALGIILLTYFLLISTILRFMDKKNFTINIKKVLLFLILLLIFSSYSIIPIVTNLHSIISESYSAALFLGGGYLSGYFNNVPNVVRLIGGWWMYQGYAPYATIYFKISIQSILLYLWPIFSIVVPILLFAKKKATRRIIFPLIFIIILMLFWEKANNFPLGFIYSSITSFSPYIPQIFPTYFFTQQFLSKIIPVLVGVSLYGLYNFNKNINKDSQGALYLKSNKYLGVNKIIKKSIPYVSIFLIVTLLLVSVSPAFTGELDGSWFNENQKGFFIPNEYLKAKNYVDLNPGKILLLPGLGIYTQTSWGYQGASQFYNSYFQPDKIYTIDSNGAYSAFNNSALSNYINLTLPLSASQNWNSIDYKYNFSGVFTYGNVSENTKWINFQASNVSDEYIKLALEKKVSLINNSYLNISLETNDPSYLAKLLRNGEALMGLGSPGGQVGWYSLNHYQNVYYKISSKNNFSIFLPISIPIYATPGSNFNSSALTDLYIKLLRGNSPINISIPQIQGSTGYSISAKWLKNILMYNISYVLVDNSIVAGEYENTTLEEGAMKLLLQNNLVSNIMSSNFISLFKINKSLIQNFLSK